MLLCLEAILGEGELAQLRALAAQAPWAGGLSAGPQARHAKHNLQIPDEYPGLREMRLLVMRALNRSDELMSAGLPHKILPPNFNRYTPEHSHYGAHVDNTLRWLPDGSCLRTDVSATLFLSAPEDYDGGELSIEDTYGQQQIKLGAGSLVLYPSGSVHEVAPVTRGERLACYVFLQSLVKDVGCRRHLYEMDRALRGLRGRHGESDPDLVRLTGSYHNLLRRWSDC